MNSNPRILKLSNGDEIICMVHDTENNYLKVSLPLKLVNMTTMNKKGEYEENLALRKWATFTDEKTFAIERTQVVMHHSVNIGLSKYYQYIVKKYKEFDNYSSLNKETKKIENTLSEEDKFENAVDEYCNYYYDEDESKKKN